MKKIFIYTAIFLLHASAVFAQGQNANSLTTAKKIIDYVVSRQSFELEETEVKNVSNLQIIDFDAFSSACSYNRIYSAAVLKSDKLNRVNFGISSNVPVKLWLNKNKLYERNDSINIFSEIAYSVFTFNDTISLELKRGDNTLIISTGNLAGAAVFIKELNVPEKAPSIRFVSVVPEIINAASCWSFFIPSGNNKTISETESINKITGKELSAFDVKYPSVKKVKKLKLNGESIFKKESYNEWNYPNGILFSSIFNYALSVDTSYLKTVSRYCSFIFETSGLFSNQYFNTHDLRTSNYRMFRKSMLDDAGSPALPFADLAIYNKNKTVYDSLLNQMADFIITRQYRLNDSTFCRPEPDRWTVWADDMFMSVPLLLRMGILKADSRYFNEAARQVININKYICDKNTGLYKHGWFDYKKETSPVFWGRANGWTLWAESEAVEMLPKDHKLYKIVKDIFKNHLSAVLSFQGKNYLWRQVMDDTASFEETSCSAMFVIGICRGITNEIIDKSLAHKAFRAWNAIAQKVDNKGIVYDICCGTGIGDSPDFYKKRDRYPNDPRGLGAVITASIEIENLKNYLKHNNN